MGVLSWRRQSGDLKLPASQSSRQDPWKKRLQLSSSKYVLANQTGESPLHTAWYINEKGDKIWLKFDSSIPCNMFPTYETRFYKPKLHKIEKDPYAEKQGRGM